MSANIKTWGERLEAATDEDGTSPEAFYFMLDEIAQLRARVAEQDRVIAEMENALRRLCTHEYRTAKQIDADWDLARAILAHKEQQA